MLRIGFLLLLLQTFCLPLLAQRTYTVIAPRVRDRNEKVIATSKATRTTSGILVALLDPIMPGKISVIDKTGRVIKEIEADAAFGRAEIELRRGQTYSIKASATGFVDAESKIRFTRPTDSVRLGMKAESATLNLPDVPQGAVVLLDNQEIARADGKGLVTLAKVTPGKHTLIIRHPEYNDFQLPLNDLAAGSVYNFFSLTSFLTRVAKITLASLPGATVYIDGALQARVNDNGSVQINYQLSDAAERNIVVELPGFHSWSQKLLLSPGPLALTAKLSPIITSVGKSDMFDNLSQWRGFRDWKIVKPAITLPDGRQIEAARAQITGTRVGVLKETIYRDFSAVFSVWMPDGKGASWVVRSDENGDNCVLFHLAGPDAADLPRMKFYTYLCKRGECLPVGSPTQVIVALNQKDNFTIEVQVREHEIKHLITSNAPGEGEKVDLGIWTNTDTERDKYLYGSFGLLAFKGEVFQVDDLTITPLDKP